MTTRFHGLTFITDPGRVFTPRPATEALVAFGVAGEDAARNAQGPGTFHAALYDALYALDPETLDSRAR